MIPLNGCIFRMTIDIQYIIMVNNIKISSLKAISVMLIGAIICIVQVNSMQISPKDTNFGITLDDASLAQVDSSLESEYDGSEQQYSKTEWLWNNYLQSTPDDKSNHYHYDPKSDKIIFSQQELAIEAEKADKTFAERMKTIHGSYQGLYQEKAELELAIEQMQGQARAQISTNVSQEQLELDLSQTEAALQTLDDNITGTKRRTLHIIPHTNTDIGWLSTTEQSFSGFQEESATGQYMGGVKDILDSVYEQLVKNESRTFTYAETKFFKMWYENQTAEVQDKTKELVKSGRLDLVNGGWSSPDEATTTYDALIDNFMIGQQWLYKTFEHHSKVSWQLDALGVSSGYARLARDVGFDMLYYSKVNLAERKEMRKNKTRTQVWRPHEENLGKRKDVLSVTLDSQKNSSLASGCWPQGFWVDQNYLQDVPMILKKNQTNYHFDKLVKSLYEEVSEYLANERTEHVFRPFGCDMAYVDAEMNYIITDQLLATWKELGYNDDIEIKYSTPTTFLKQMQAVNQEWTAEAPHAGWPLRRDGTFPYGSAPDVYENGYYSSRPQLKRDIRRVSQKFHSSQRLVAQQVLKVNATEQDIDEILDHQYETLDNLGVLQHNGIMGTTPNNVALNYTSKATKALWTIERMNAKFLSKELNSTLNITVGPESLDATMGFQIKEANVTTAYQEEDQIMFVVQNPTQQIRLENIEVQVPYHNYTVWEFTDGKLEERKTFDKFLPRTWKNSNRTFVPSSFVLPVNFANSYDVAKVFIVKNLGYLKDTRRANGTGQVIPWNLNLPQFKQASAHDIHNYPSNYKKLKPKANITAGNKTLVFLEVKKASKGGASGADKTFFHEDQQTALKQLYGGGGKGKQAASNSSAGNSTSGSNSSSASSPSASGPSSGNTTSQGGAGRGKGKKKGDENIGAAVFQYFDNSTGISQKFAFNLRYYIGAYYDKSKEKNATMNTTSGAYPNATSLRQDHRSDGMYEFSVNGTSNKTQQSLKYGNIALKKSKYRQNNDTAEILLLWEQSYSKLATKLFNASANASAAGNSTSGGNSTGGGRGAFGNATQDKQMLLQSVGSGPGDTNSSFKPPDKIRAAARITLSDNTDFIKFEVTINDLPVALDQTGKDVVVDWYMLENFDSGRKFWADANGLEMVPQQLFQHRDYNYTSNNTVSANFYPVTSAIAIRDVNRSRPVTTANKSEGTNSSSPAALAALAKLPGFAGQKQVTIMNDRSQGGSAGLRSGKNIEFMQHRRFKKMDSYGVNEPLNELDTKGRGIQVKATYWMQISDAYGKFQNSTQRSNQRDQDQPLLIYYSKNYSLPSGNTYTPAEAPSYEIIKEIQSLLEKQPSPAGEAGQTPDFGGENDAPNKQYKESKTLKSIVYAKGRNEISLRLANLEDHFDKSADTQTVDLNAWAREYYLEANDHNITLMKDLKIEIQEMNLGGSIPKDELKAEKGGKYALTKWKTDQKYDPKHAPVKPLDFLQNYSLPASALSQPGKQINEVNYLINLEPQRLRVFNIKYVREGTDKEAIAQPAVANQISTNITQNQLNRVMNRPVDQENSLNKQSNNTLLNKTMTSATPGQNNQTQQQMPAIINASVKAKFTSKQAPAPKKPTPPTSPKAKAPKPLISPVRVEGEFMTTKAPEMAPVSQFIAQPPPLKPAAVSQKQIKPIATESTQASSPAASKKEEGVKDADAEGDYSEFTASAMKAASHEAQEMHSLSTEDLDKIIGDNTNVQIRN